MFQASVYKIMFAAPSDIQEEIMIVKETIQSWNSLHAERESIVLFPLHWSSNSHPTTGTHPQKAINKQLVEKSDMLICVFGSKLGTPTDNFESGTTEEIEEHRKAGKPVMIFFRKSTNNIDNLDIEQLSRLKSYKESIQDKALYCEYSDSSDFKRILPEKLQLCINEHFIKEKNVSTLNKVVKFSFEKPFSILEKERIKEWTESKDDKAYEYHLQKGSWIIGGIVYKSNSPRESAEYEDFFNRLLKKGYVEKKYDSKCNDFYKLTLKGYEFAETL